MLVGLVSRVLARLELVAIHLLLKYETEARSSRTRRNRSSSKSNSSGSIPRPVHPKGRPSGVSFIRGAGHFAFQHQAKGWLEVAGATRFLWILLAGEGAHARWQPQLRQGSGLCRLRATNYRL